MTPIELTKIWKSIKEEQKVIGFYSHKSGNHIYISNFYKNNPFYYKIPENCGIHTLYNIVKKLLCYVRHH
jgi:hypothetical protein